MNDSLVARVAALKTSPTPDLKQMWREMFLTEPPPFNRRFLETRLAYRIQELALGGLRRETIKYEPERLTRQGRPPRAHPVCSTKLHHREKAGPLP